MNFQVGDFVIVQDSNKKEHAKILDIKSNTLTVKRYSYWQWFWVSVCLLGKSIITRISFMSRY